MDDTLIGRGLKRTPLPRFLLWLVPWAALLALGLYAVYLCFAVGLNQTNMDNRFAFGLWIYLDLTVIALGAGAFFTCLLYTSDAADEPSKVVSGGPRVITKKHTDHL